MKLSRRIKHSQERSGLLLNPISEYNRMIATMQTLSLLASSADPRSEHIQSTTHENSQEPDLLSLGNLQPKDESNREQQDHNISEDVESVDREVESISVNALRVRNRQVPACLCRRATENQSPERSHAVTERQSHRGIDAYTEMFCW